MTTQPTADAPAEADTQEAAAPDTAANTQQSQQPIDWQARYKALQAEATRKAQALAAREQELAELRSGAYEEPDENEDGEPVQRTRKVSRTSQREVELTEALEEAEWTIARAIYPDEVIDAYGAAATLLEQASTAADYVAAFEAYHLARSQGATPEQAAAASGGTPPPAAVMPRTDSNRSDAPALPEIEQEIREAERKKDLAGFVAAKFKLGR